MIAHVLTGNPVPLVVQWLVAALLFGGALAALASRRTGWRRVAVAGATCGLIGTASTWVVGAMQPGAAPYGLRIATPAPGTTSSTRAVFTLCGIRADGTMTTATDADHHLALFVDGRQVSTVDVSQVPLTLQTGVHDVRFVLVNAANQSYNPTATAEERMTVSDTAQESGPRAC